jgi:CheY-like chemotaxis protein
MSNSKDRAEKATAPESGAMNEIATRLSAAVGNPAQTILSLASEVMDTPLGSVQREQVRRIHQAAQSLLGVVNDLADFARLNEGSLILAKAPFSLRDMVAQVAGSRVRAAQEKGLLLQVETDSDVPDQLAGDASRLGQVLGHLLDNAIRQTEQGEVSLRIEPEFITQQEATLAFTVNDTSSVSLDEVKAYIKNGAKAGLAGPASLGLSVAQGLVKTMGGTLQPTKRAGGGCSLAFSVACGKATTNVDKPATERFASLVALPVLLVSDDGFEREELAKLFQGWHMRPLEADSGDMAIALLENAALSGERIPLMVFTNRIHDHDGFMLALQIKRNPVIGETRLIMLTSEGRRGDAMKCREIGVAGYLPKPINPHDLHAAVNTLMGIMREQDYAPTLVTRHSLREKRQGAAILLVEDDRDSQLLAAHFLDRDRFSVVLAANGGEALSMAEQQKFDLILLDMELPGTDGFKTAEQIRAVGKVSADVPIIALTAATSIERQKRFQAAGITDFLQKPLKRDALLAIVFRYVVPVDD